MTYRSNFDNLYKFLDGKYRIPKDEAVSIINDAFLRCGMDADLALLVWECKLRAKDWWRSNGSKTRGGKDRLQFVSLEELAEDTAVDMNGLTALESKQNFDYLEYNLPEYISRLEKNEQVIVYEIFINRCSIQKLSQMLGISVVTIPRIYQRTLEKLRGMIEKRNATPPNTTIKKENLFTSGISTRLNQSC